MLSYKNTVLSGWGNYPKQSCVVFRPEKQREVSDILTGHTSSTIGRGAGKSYGDAALNWEGVVSFKRLNRILSFDTEQGILSAQTGVTLKEILDVAVPAGWFVPVLPGTKYVTLGGAFASNVHGKNSFSLGDFAKHVLEVKLRTPHQLITCSAEENPLIFWCTAGGMGMTGLIEELTLKLIPIASSSLQKETFRVRNIDALLDAFRSYAGKSEYMVGWVDHFASGSKFGQGVFESAGHPPKGQGRALQEFKPEPEQKPFPGASFMLNALSMRLYNKRRFGQYTDAPKTEESSFEDFFHPLDKYSDWNKLYGSKGFLQYQFILPEHPEVAQRIKKILETIQNMGQHGYLTVIKYHDRQEGLLSFSMKGFSVALDLPNTPKVLQMLNDIDLEVLKFGGRVYLAKDARLKPEIFQRMYAERLEEWRVVIRELDPERRINSTMARRLHFRGMI